MCLLGMQIKQVVIGVIGLWPHQLDSIRKLQRSKLGENKVSR